MAGARAAEFFRDRDAEKAHTGETLPQLAVIGLLAVEHRAHRLGRAFFGEKLSRFVAELFLFVGEIEIHGGVPLPNRSFRGALKTRTRNLEMNNLWIPDRSEVGPSGMTMFRGALLVRRP